MDDNGLRCSCTVEYLDQCGQLLRKQAIKTAVVVLGRNELGDVALRVTHSDGMLGPFTLREHAIHKRFVSDGKATIRLITQRIQLFVSNCPTALLVGFLHCVAVKVGARGKLQGSGGGMLPESSLGFEDISPLTERDLQAVASNGGRILGAPSGTTPQRGGTAPKRKLSDISNTVSSRGILSGLPAVDSNPAKKRKLMRPASNFSLEQSSVLEKVKKGQTLFFTGSAGTGKSYLLKEIIAALPPDTTYATASTGSAASQIGGTTLHSFAGIGTGRSTLEHCIQLASTGHKAAQWKKCQCLIIDEISMIDADYFDKLEAVACAVRKSKQPFGGIQLVLCGDFFQLPPVTKEGEKKYCFQAKSWRECVTCSVELTQIYRQIDNQFIAILQNIRIGRCPPAATRLLQDTKHQDIEKEGIRATHLYTHTEDVEATNARELSALRGPSQLFPAHDSDCGLSKVIDNLCPVVSHLELKAGAQVMLMKNIDVSSGLVNGARGVVRRFDSTARGDSVRHTVLEGILPASNPTSTGRPVVRFASGLEMTVIPEKFVVKLGGGGVATRRQLPLRLAWAISVHKSQGMTLDCVEISLGKTFEDGQAYVALSRARSLKCLRVTDFQSSCVRAHPAVLEFYRALRKMRRNYIT